MQIYFCSLFYIYIHAFRPNPEENNSAKVLSNTAEKKVDKKNLDDECKPSSNFSLVPYLSESSESDGEFVQPKPSPTKDPPKSSEFLLLLNNCVINTAYVDHICLLFMFVQIQ